MQKKVETIAVLCAVSGQFIPPFIVFSKSNNPVLMTCGLPNNAFAY